MRRIVFASKHKTRLSGCAFDFDLGDNYDESRLESEIYDIFADHGCSVQSVDFGWVDYPRGRTYSQCTVDFEWVDDYDGELIERELERIIDDEGGNYFGASFYSLDAPVMD